MANGSLGSMTELIAALKVLRGFNDSAKLGDVRLSIQNAVETKINEREERTRAIRESLSQD